MPCHIPYIPDRLHANGRDNVNVFYLEEVLYRRCPKANVQDPFGGISLVDLSVNRSGQPENILCMPEDVLFNPVPENGKGQILDEAIIPLKIKELTEDGQYTKSYTYPLPEDGVTTHSCKIHLKHKKEECNYSHSAFEISYDGTEIKNFDEYKKTLKKNSVLRTWCKTEISKMIIREEIRINWPNDINEI